jgi:hypothetical protein
MRGLFAPRLTTTPMLEVERKASPSCMGRNCSEWPDKLLLRRFHHCLSAGPRSASSRIKPSHRIRNVAQHRLQPIDGVITRRNVNPGDNVQVGQGLMAIRSLDEIWVDANFKETELGDLRIG